MSELLIPMETPATLIALLHGPDQPGLVARVAGWIYERGGNILHADQHRDMELGVFFPADRVGALLRQGFGGRAR